MRVRGQRDLEDSVENKWTQTKKDEPNENQKKVNSKEENGDSFQENRHKQDLQANQLLNVEECEAQDRSGQAHPLHDWGLKIRWGIRRS